MILLTSLSKQYRHSKKIVLDDITAAFPPRCHVAIISDNLPSKNALLSILCGSELPSDGVVERGMSVSFPVGTGMRIPPNLTLGQFLDFIAGVYSVDTRELGDFALRTAKIKLAPHQMLSELNVVDNRRLNFVLSYAIPFDCYLFNEVLDSGVPADAEMFDRLFTMRSAEAATILTTASRKTLARYAELEPDYFCLHRSKLWPCADADEAFRMLQGSPPPADLPPPAVNAISDEIDQGLPD